MGRRPGTRFALVAVGIVAAGLGFDFLTWRSVHSFVTSIDRCDRLFCDFVLYFYPAGKEVLATGKPVPFFFYPPFAALFFSLWGRAAPHASVILWGIFQALSLVLLAVVPGVLLRRRAGSCWAVGASLAFLVTSFPVLHNFAWGQVSVLVVLLMMLAFLQYEAGRSTLSAGLLALAVSLKLYPVLALLYFILRKDGRYLLRFLVLTLVFSVVIPCVFLGPGRALQYADTVLANLSAMDWTRHPPSLLNSQFALFVVNRLSDPGHVWTWTAPWLAVVVAFAGLVLLAFLLLHLHRRRLSHEPHWALVLSFLATPFVLRTSWPHYFVFLPFAQAFLGTELLRNPARSKAARVEGALLLLASVVLSSVPFFKVFPHWSQYTGGGCLFFADLLLVLLAMRILWREDGRSRSV